MKKIISVILLGTIALSFSGCGKIEKITLEKAKILTDYEATYYVTNGDSQLEYENKYTVKTENDKLTVSSVVEIEYESAAGEKGMQKMTAVSTINFGENPLLGVPENIEEEFSIDIDKTQYTAFTFAFDNALKSGIITTKRYDKEEENGIKQKVYSVALKEQYFDKDSLPFLLGGFSENDGVIYVSAGNRDRLQAIRFEFLGFENISTKNGSEINCKAYLFRPNSMFGQSSATIWISTEGKPVKVINGNSSMLLVE